jgi:hypothetical protein
VVAKHRRSETPSLASAGMRVSAAECWVEAAGDDRAVATAALPRAAHAATRRAWNRYPSSIDYNDHPDGPVWAGREAPPWLEWEEWQDRQDWGPPPALHPDHPSAPVPRVQIPADHPSGAMQVPRAPGPPGRSGARGTAAPSPPQRGPGRTRTPGRHDSVTTTATVGYLTLHHEVSAFHRQPGSARPEALGYHRRVGSGMPGSNGYRGPAPVYRPGAGPATEWLEDDSSADEDPLWMAGQVLTLADDKAALIAQEAQDDAAAIREAAQRDAAAIREAAEREAAELRARLNSMLGELGRITAYLTESLAGPALSAIAPALPATAEALRVTAVAMPAVAPTLPDARPARPATRPARPSGRPATKPAGRQAKAMRKMVAAFAVASVLGAVAGTTELALHGLPFFIFRANGAGASEVGPREPANAPRAGQPFLPGVHHRPAPHQQSSKSKN